VNARRTAALVALLVVVAALAVVLVDRSHSEAASRAALAPAAAWPAGGGTHSYRLAALAGADPAVPLAQLPRAAVLFNVSGGQVLWQHSAETRLRIASLTKMMTALIVVEHTRERERVLIRRRPLNVGGSKLGYLKPGTRVPVRTLLYALLLPSANDAANELAVHVAGSIRAFVALMNEHAARYGLHCTHYVSPSGVINRGNYSCAHDLAEIAMRVLATPRLARIVGTAQIMLPFPPPEHEIELVNNNPLLLYRFPGTLGVKTGYTEEAGRCLVAAVRRDGVTLGVVLLHSNAPGGQARGLFEWAFAHVYHLPPAHTAPLPAGA
jgi:D-alanyl-D-alanine carboxypeptidase